VAVLFKKGTIMLNIDEQKIKMIKKQLKEEWHKPKDVLRHLEPEITKARKLYSLTTLCQLFNKTFNSNISYYNFQKILYRTKKRKEQEQEKEIF